MLRPINVSGQLGRVIAIMRDGKRRTLREIERECWTRYGHADTQAAISARLRQVHEYGYRKQAHIERINDKAVWWYFLTPINSAEEQAA